MWVGSMPDAYDRFLAPVVFKPFAMDLARRVASHSPRRVLELAAGTGVLTRELVAALPAAEVTATDFNTAMVAYGKRQVPERYGSRPTRSTCPSTTISSISSSASSALCSSPTSPVRFARRGGS